MVPLTTRSGLLGLLSCLTLGVALLTLTAAGNPAPPAVRAAHTQPCKPKPISLQLSAARVPSGQTVTGTVAISCRRARRVPVALTAFPGASVPRAVAVPAGKKSVSFTVTTEASSADRNGAVVATVRRRTVNAMLAIEGSGTPTGPAGSPVSTPTMTMGQSPRNYPANSRDELVDFWLRLAQPAPKPSGFYVDITTDHPAVFAEGPAFVWPGDYDTHYYRTIGAVTQPTVVTVTGHVVDHPEITGSFQFLARPGVATIDAPSTLVSGMPFTATVLMQGPADIDQQVWFHGEPFIHCTPDMPTLPAGASSVSSSCVAASVDQEETHGMGIWLDYESNYQQSFTVVPAEDG